ncbi:piggyBac transposable element-derived protein 4-like [Schistocerca serialis cubense]|uniref:piggyBac transposable element-derived protein 4-like n=1 Tax=Schistocerca serialis cubense TaxID=2023355 RepID=UPI00214E7DF2|nr:piggyBac transposable element-derived protein 4-like [Schistocerca serialis cubense]
MASSKSLTDDELERIVNDPTFLQSDEETTAAEDEFILSDHDSTSEATSESSCEESDEEACIRPSADKYFFGKKQCYKWSKEAPPTTRTRAHNIVCHLPGSKRKTKTIDSTDILSAWELFISEDLLQLILTNTNVKIHDMSNKYRAPKPAFIRPLDIDELRAFLGLLYLSGVMKSNHENVGLFANDGTGRDVFRATMSVQRFLFILSCLRFDCAATRDARKADDRLAAIRDVRELFIDKCQKYYTPGAYVTIDEMLVPFRGRCKFRMYMPKKPAKYGLKVMCL